MLKSLRLTAMGWKTHCKLDIGRFADHQHFFQMFKTLDMSNSYKKAPDTYVPGASVM